MKRFAITLVTLFALAAMSLPAEAANNNWDLAKSAPRPSVSGFRIDVGDGSGNHGNVSNGNGNVNNGNVNNGRHHHHHGGSYGRSSYPYGYGYPTVVYPSYGYGGYGGYGYYNSGIPAASFANPTAYGFGPGAIFGW